MLLVSSAQATQRPSLGRTLFKHCGTNLRFSTAYHPQTDGLSERTIRTVIDTLRCCLDSTYELSAKTEYEVLTEQIAQQNALIQQLMVANEQQGASLRERFYDDTERRTRLPREPTAGLECYD